MFHGYLLSALVELEGSRTCASRKCDYSRGPRAAVGKVMNETDLCLLGHQTIVSKRDEFRTRQEEVIREDYSFCASSKHSLCIQGMVGR